MIPGIGTLAPSFSTTRVTPITGGTNRGGDLTNRGLNFSSSLDELMPVAAVVALGLIVSVYLWKKL